MDAPRACESCLEILPANPGRGRPRKYHEGPCTRAAELAAERIRDGVQRPREPRRDTCRLCADPVPAGRWYYCSEDCMRRFEVLNHRERNLVAAYSDTAGPEGTTASAAEIEPAMSWLAASWRVDRWLRLLRVRSAAG